MTDEPVTGEETASQAPALSGESPSARRHRWPWLALGLFLFVTAGVAAFLLPPPLLIALLGGGAVILVWLFFPEAVILLFLLARSTVDGFMELFTLFSGSALSMNLSGAVNSLAVGLGVLTFLRRWARHAFPVSYAEGGDRRGGSAVPFRRWAGGTKALLVAGPGRAYALFLLVALASIPGSVDVASGIKEWARLASGLAVYQMVADVVPDERRARRFVAALFASSLIPLAVAWFQTLTGGGYFFLGFVGTEFAYRPQGTFAHPAALGSYLIILLTLAVGLFFTEGYRRLRPLLLAWAAVAASSLVLTLARAQWLGMAVASLVVGFLKKWWLSLVVLLVGVSLLAGVPLLRERLTASESVQWRLNLWEVARGLAWPPTWLGRGLATSPWHINQLLPKVESPPHNDYLKVVLETGALGLLAYGTWLCALLRHAWRAYRRAQTSSVAWRALCLLAVVIAGMVMSVVDNYLGYTAVQWYFWALVALVPAGGG